MIAPANEDKSVRFLCLGLEANELNTLKKIAQSMKGTVQNFSNEMNLWSSARSGNFELVVLGQTKEIKDPSYLVWLLKGMAKNSRIILIYSKISEEEANRLQRNHASHIMQRPVDGNRLHREIISALNSKEQKPRKSFWSSLRSNLSFQKKKTA